MVDCEIRGKHSRERCAIKENNAVYLKALVDNCREGVRVMLNDVINVGDIISQWNEIV